MKYKIFILLMLIPLILVGCTQQENIVPENDIEEEEIITPPHEVVPAVQYDRLIHFHERTKIYSNGKYLATLDKNDMLPLLDEDNNYYISNFNYNTIYINKNSNVSIRKFEKGSKRVENVIKIAKETIGTKYVYGAERYHYNGVKNSNFNKYYFDCSSLTQYAYFVGTGISINADSRSQYANGKFVSKSNIRRGDLLFFTNRTRKDYTGVNRIGHVAIYLGENYILHTSSDYAIIEPISNTRWNYYIGARRIVD